MPDAVMYNALLPAYTKSGDVAKVKNIFNKMVQAEFKRDEITYNTIINMYGRKYCLM
jgi:pentatricopeptide repeat protein